MDIIEVSIWLQWLVSHFKQCIAFSVASRMLVGRASSSTLISKLLLQAFSIWPIFYKYSLIMSYMRVCLRNHRMNMPCIHNIICAIWCMSSLLPPIVELEFKLQIKS